MSDRDKASSTFVIATRNRPEELQITVESIVAQTVLPSELCVVDSSTDTPARSHIQRLCADSGLHLDYVHPAPQGLPRQRNFGLDRTTGDPVFLVDDDVFLAPDCHEVILEEYDRWGPELGGVRAAPVRPARPPLISIMWRKLFGIGAWWPEASGRVRAGFWLEGTSESAGVRKQEAFVGYFMSYRRQVFDHERFDEALSGYASQEDIDFSYRVSRRYVLIQTPRAKCDHFKTGTNRMPSRKLERMKLANHFYLHRKNMPQDLKHKGALWWGLLGLLIHNVVKAIVRGDPGLVIGIVVGAWEQSRGRGLIDPAEEDGAPGAWRAVG
ncbi:MAG: glycosyltransferase [Actinomycetota bacterium]|nr:glycosyltransferase [Actinomycetota bacterium]